VDGRSARADICGAETAKGRPAGSTESDVKSVPPLSPSLPRLFRDWLRLCVVQTFRFAVPSGSGRPEGLHYTKRKTL
jgi:hypothetical protein